MILGWFGLSVVSAAFQVLRNVAMKRLGHALDEYITVWGRFTCLLPFMFLFTAAHGFPALRPGYWMFCLLFGICQNVGTLALSKAFKYSDISLVTALWKLSLLILLVGGYLTLREVPTPLGAVGVLLSVAGVYLLNVRWARQSLFAPLAVLFTDRGMRYTLAAAFLYAPSVLLIKHTILLSDPYAANLGAYAAASLLSTPLVLLRSRRHFREIHRHWREFVGLGLFAALSSTAHSLAYRLTLTSYVEAVKQVEVLFAMLVGMRLFGERNRVREIWLGCTVMLAGVVVLQLWG